MKITPIIKCENVSLAYGRQQVLNNVNLNIMPGSFLPFVGPNGAGKTTLLRAILGLIKPKSGRIINNFARQAPGYVPQYKVIDPIYPVSVRQIVTMGLYPELKWYKRPSDRQKQRVQQALDNYDLTDHAGKTFDCLSGGMKQKVMLARAFASGAEVFIMDEPTSELDDAAQQEVLEHLFELTRKHKKTVLLAHHGVDSLVHWADTLCMVEHSRAEIVQTSQLYPRGSWLKKVHAKQRTMANE